MVGACSRVLAAALVMGLTVACRADDTTAPTTEPVPVPTTSPVVVRPDDGVLRIGLLLPTSGEGLTIGQFMSDAAQRAVREINSAGGIGGSAIEVETADEGETPGEAASAIAELVEQDVDAVVGPASSTTTLATLDLLVAADVLTCSPSATALALDEFPDDDLFFRTAPSDSLQAIGIAQIAEDTGETSVAVTWLDDVYGRPFAAEVIRNLRAGSAPFEIVAQAPFNATTEDLGPAADEIAGQEPGVVIVIADAEQGARMLTALGEALETSSGWTNPDVIVNDAIRDPPSPQTIADLPPTLRDGIQGLSPRAEGDSLPGAFATNAYDCVNLIALAASQVRSNDARIMAEQLPALSGGGGPCQTFDECRASLEDGRNIDYEGPGGQVEIGADGDPERARFTPFRFTAEGIDESAAQDVTVTG